MILGMPWTSWLLLGVAVGIGLSLELAFYRARRGERRAPGVSPFTPGPGEGTREGAPPDAPPPEARR